VNLRYLIKMGYNVWHMVRCRPSMPIRVATDACERSEVRIPVHKRSNPRVPRKRQWTICRVANSTSFHKSFKIFEV